MLLHSDGDEGRSSDGGVDAARRIVGIVDDDQRLVELYSMTLESQGYRSITALDGDEIVQKVLGEERGPTPDIIVMDYRMPKMNGLIAASKILEERPAVKIIIATADDSIKKEVEAAGMVFLQKPFGPADLTRTIKEILHE
jgi:two-component system, OmpR family, response regulator MtrA